MTRYLPLLLVASCAFDSSGSGDDDPGTTDAAATTPDSAVVTADARPQPDAPPDVECTSAADCETPPDLCHRPGVCNLTLGKCQFAPIDCSSMDDDCNVGVCNIADGSCEKAPAFEDTECAPSTYTDYTACDFAMVCDLSGSRSRTRTDYTCVAGSCTPADSPEVDTCTRPPGDVNGDPCGSDTCGDCGPCGYAGTCAETGTCTRPCLAHQCNTSGACVEVPYSMPDTCSRDTDGLECFTCPGMGMGGCSCSAGECVAGGGGG